MPDSRGIPTLADVIGQVDNWAQSLQKEKAARELEAYKRQLDAEQQQAGLRQAQSLVDQYAGKGKRVNVGLSGNGGVTLAQAESDPLADTLRALQLEALISDREDRKLERLQDDVTKSGAPQAVQSLQRAEKTIPGVTSGQAKFKSVGGVKNLAPNFAVPVLEKLGVMDPGASEERAALQELQNAKIYDSSGKQINEAEMRRISDAMGLRGIFSPNTINDATKQVSQTVLEKNRGITAGYQPRTVNKFKQQGGIGGAKTLQELLGPSSAPTPTPSPSPAPSSTPAPMSFEEFKARKRAGTL